MIRVPIQLRYSDYDERGHVNNAVYLTYLELGRVEAWRTVAGDDTTPPAFVVAQARIDYRSPALLGEPLVVEVHAGEVRSKAWTWTYRVVQAATGRVIAEGETTQVAYDYAANRSMEIPAAMRAGLERIGKGDAG